MKVSERNDLSWEINKLPINIGSVSLEDGRDGAEEVKRKNKKPYRK